MAQEKTFSEAKQVVVIRPRSMSQQEAFMYNDFSDLKKLIQFVGSKPAIDEDGNLWFKKVMIPDNSIVLRNSYGQVTDVLDADEAAEKYEVVASHEFTPADANKVVAKPVKTSDGTKGMTRTDLKNELTKAGIAFKSGLTKDALQAIWDAR